MKKLLLTIVNTFVIICGVYSQDTLATNVYQKINEIRVQNNLGELLIDEPLELASAQHGCWLSIYNIRIDTNQVVVISEEDNTPVTAKRFKMPKDRVVNFTNRTINNIEESLNYYYTKPTSDDVVDFMKDKILSDKFKYQGFWIIKFETLDEKPIWYLVYLITD